MKLNHKFSAIFISVLIVTEFYLNREAIKTPYVKLRINFGSFIDNSRTNYGGKSDQTIEWKKAVVHNICG